MIPKKTIESKGGKLTQEQIKKLDMLSYEDVKDIAEALNISEFEAAAFAQSPFSMDGEYLGFYSEEDGKAGFAAAKKFLGPRVYGVLDPDNFDVPEAVLNKIHGRG